jgi:hypothetical protein
MATTTALLDTSVRFADFFCDYPTLPIVLPGDEFLDDVIYRIEDVGFGYGYNLTALEKDLSRVRREYGESKYFTFQSLKATKLGKDEEAFLMSQQAVNAAESDKERAGALGNLSADYLVRRERKEAEIAAKKSQNFGDTVQGHLNLALVRLFDGKEKEAEAEVRKLLQLETLRDETIRCLLGGGPLMSVEGIRRLLLAVA